MIIFFFSLPLFGIDLLPPEERYGRPRERIIEVERIVYEKSAPEKNGSGIDSSPAHGHYSTLNNQVSNSMDDYQRDAYILMQQLNQANERIRELTTKRGPIPHIVERNFSIMPLDEFRGIILNSALISNYSSEITVHSVEPNGPLQGATLDCSGSMLRKRIKVYCSRIIWRNDVKDIHAILRDGVDGVDAIKADEVWTGEEAEFLKASFATLAGGIFDSAKGRSRTDIGDVENAEAKNRVLGGLISVADENTQRSMRRTQQQEIVGVLEAGKMVTIQFLERLEL